MNDDKIIGIMFLVVGILSLLFSIFYNIFLMKKFYTYYSPLFSGVGIIVLGIMLLKWN